MTLRRWVFVKAARERVRGEVFTSEAMSKEYGMAHAARRRRHRIRSWMYRALIAASLLVAVLLGFRFPVATIEAFLVLWTFYAAFSLAGVLRAALYDDPVLVVFDYLPISDADIFQEQWKRFLYGSWWVFFDFTAAYSLLLLHSSGGWHALAGGVALGVVQWLFLVAMAVCLLAFVNSNYFASSAGISYLAANVLVYTSLSQSRFCAWISSLAWSIPPSGWILQSLGVFGGGGLFQLAWPVVWSATALALAPIAFQRVRQGFLLSEPKHATDGRIPEVIASAESHAQSPDEARAAIQRRQFLDGFDWPRAAFLERLVARLLNPRERLVAEFITAAKLGWTNRLRGLLVAAALGGMLGWVFARQLSSGGGVGLLGVFFFTLASFAGSWRGFTPPAGGGLQSPIYAVYPIGFWEMMRVMLKVNLARFVISIPFVVAILFILTLNPAFARTGLLEFGLKIIALGFMAQPLVAVGEVSPGTNDTQNAGRAFAAVLWLLGLVGAGITFFAAEKPVVVLLAGRVTTALSVFALALYSRWFNRSQIDLVPLTRMEPVGTQ